MHSIGDKEFIEIDISATAEIIILLYNITRASIDISIARKRRRVFTKEINGNDVIARGKKLTVFKIEFYCRLEY